MRLPNGYGSVTKLNRPLRKPWRAMKSYGYDDDGKLRRVTVGYFATKVEALEALAQFNVAPYDRMNSRRTFRDIYLEWFEDQIQDPTSSRAKNARWAYNSAADIHNIPIGDLRPMHMQNVIKKYDSYQRQKKMITIFNQIFKYCAARDYVTKNYAEPVHTTVSSTERTKERIPFSKEERLALWDNIEDDKYRAVPLILIYSGVRIGELLALRSEDVNLEEQYFHVRKSKTESGVRVVPIADCVLPYWKAFREVGSEYAIPGFAGGQIDYSNFNRFYWRPVLEAVGLNHTIHETRHTFISMAKEAEIDSTITKKIVGHKKAMDLTERVYTHIRPEILLAAVNKIASLDVSPADDR